MKKSFKIAFGGIISAFSVILILLGNIPMAEYVGPTFAGILLAWAVIEMGAIQSLWVFAASGLLSFLLSGNKEPVMLYVLFFGYFPILKDVLQRKVKLRVVRWVIKVIVFNVSMVVAYLLLVYVFGMPLEDMQDFGKYTVLAAVCLIRHDQNIVIRIDRRLIRLVELLNQRENKARISLELFDQIRATGGHELLALRLSQ